MCAEYAIKHAHRQGYDEDDDGSHDDVCGNGAHPCFKLVHGGALDTPVLIIIASNAVVAHAGLSHTVPIIYLVGVVAEQAHVPVADIAVGHGTGVGGSEEIRREEDRKNDEHNYNEKMGNNLS